MTDKQIIIDGVDVSGCHNKTFYKNDEGDVQCKCYRFEDADSDTLLFGICKQHPNCYYKQLKRKEQECERLKYDNGYEVGALEKTIDNLKAENDTLFKAIEEVNKINKRLKAENDELKAKNSILEDEYKILEDNLDSRTRDFEEVIDQILTEIKEIVEEQLPTVNYNFAKSMHPEMFNCYEQILQKISEVE